MKSCTSARRRQAGVDFASATGPKAAIKVAILPVEDRSGLACLDWIAYGFMSELRNRVEVDSRFDVASSQQVLAAIESACVDAQDVRAQAVRQVLDADAVVELVVSRVGLKLEASCLIVGRSSQANLLFLGQASADTLLDEVSVHLPEALMSFPCRGARAASTKHLTHERFIA